jgi:hypothetical protein
MSQRYGIPFLDSAEFAEYREKQMESSEVAEKWLVERIRPRLRPFWYFTVILCQQLQEGENALSPSDAYWIGAVDEVYGTKLNGYRALMESDSTVDVKDFVAN